MLFSPGCGVRLALALLVLSQLQHHACACAVDSIALVRHKSVKVHRWTEADGSSGPDKVRHKAASSSATAIIHYGWNDHYLLAMAGGRRTSNGCLILIL